MYKKILGYFRQHVCYNSVVHVLAGIGVGILITYPIVGSHPLRYAAAFLGVALVGHLYPLFAEK